MEQTDIQKMTIIVGQHAGKILTLAQIGFFDMVNGSVTVHFANDGRIVKLDRHNIFSIT